MILIRNKQFSTLKAANDSISKFLTRNRKPIGYTGGAIVLGTAAVGGYKGYKESKNN